MTKTLDGKIALVTGGSRGIGAAIARELSDQGAHVAISYASSADKADAIVKEIEAKGLKSVAFKADSADTAQVKKLIADVVAKFGRLDILVNNAGLFHYGLVTDSTHEDDLDDLYAVNTDAVMTGIREAGRVMGEGGRIISISTGLSTRTGAVGLADYAASKAAIDGFTRGAAHDLGGKGITVNVIGTGPVNTEMNPEDGPISDWLKGQTPLGRYARVEEISAAVAFLASPRASYITGSVMAVDGGIGA
ncbi:SDR family NAD(P)-dependent oxidoreductase [Sphingomonas sp. PAMC 26605]|uniref:SDR family NAD(P)-dependent oxidoreductase n=1 Tax=Sphingomonas sp. PAMC 26605 TaxID=1112214 RepID=UPI00026CB1A9|nr:SDR family oxidoreductase [Sphingomonas sp. PAMC 26605]